MDRRHHSSAKPSVHYQLFVYREELRRRDPRQLRLSKTKITLTDRLISENVQNLQDCSVEDLRVISREMTFKKQLQKQVCRIRRLQSLGVQHDWELSSLVSTDL